MELEALERKTGYAFLHLGLCSSDIVEGARDIQIALSMSSVIRPRLKSILATWAAWVDRYDETVTQGYTHLLPASATTWGYRAATTLEGAIAPTLGMLRHGYPMRGFRGAVGTEAPQVLLGLDNSEFLSHVTICAGQSPNRTFLLEIAQEMSLFAMNAHKIAADFRMGTALGTMKWENHGKASSSLVAKQVNPTYAERVCSIARMIPGITNDIWDAGAHSYMERTLDDSAVLRIRIPELFHLFNQLLSDLETMFERALPVDGVTDNFAAAAETDVVQTALSGKVKSRREAQAIIRNTPDISGGIHIGRAKENSQEVIKQILRVLNNEL